MRCADHIKDSEAEDAQCVLLISRFTGVSPCQQFRCAHMEAIGLIDIASCST